jgi:Terminase large subunit, T4likevirus-type, N-terminal/Terminase RNaseH-like domain
MLTISRPDIESEGLMDVPAKDRFIKLPIEPYLKLLPSPSGNGSVWEEINAPQIALINALNSPKYRFICGALARRLGKTFISNVIGQLVVLVPGTNVLIISPNFSLSSISFELQRKLIKQFDLEIERDNLKDKIIELANGSTVRMGSISTVDSTVGRSYDLIIFDEAALSEKGEEAFNVSLRPTLDRRGSKAIFISTPRGKNNWFSKFFNRGFSAEYPEWCSIHADWTENSRMTVSDVEEAKRSMSKAEFEQEYMASFNSYEGQIFQLRDEHVEEYVKLDGDEVFAGIDVGYRDPTAFITIVYSPQRDCFHIVDEYLKSEAVTAVHAETFKEIIEKWQLETIFIDAAAAQFSADLAYGYDIPTIKAKKDVLPGIAYVQSVLETGRLKIDPSCKETLVAFDQYQWDQKEGLQREKPLHTNSHIPDAVRYAIYTYTL